MRSVLILADVGKASVGVAGGSAASAVLITESNSNFPFL